jgi:hypothetical protein
MALGPSFGDDGGVAMVIFGSNGKNVIGAEGPNCAAAWRGAVDQARAHGVLNGSGWATRGRGTGVPGRLVTKLAQDLAKEPLDALPDPRGLALTVAGHVQDVDRVRAEPIGDVRWASPSPGRDHKIRPARVVASRDRGLGARRLDRAEPERCV